LAGGLPTFFGSVSSAIYAALRSGSLRSALTALLLAPLAALHADDVPLPSAKAVFAEGGNAQVVSLDRWNLGKKK
jgi:hypothetical protein